MIRLRGTRELRFHWLVASIGLALKKVRKAPPRPIGQKRLVDDIDRSSANRLLGEPLSLSSLRSFQSGARDSEHAAAFSLESSKVRRLVLLTFPPNELRVWICEDGACEISSGNRKFDLREMGARKEAR
jgi:hypothetical protein